MVEKRIFEVQPDEGVMCSVDCRIGEIRSRLMIIDGKDNLCTAHGTPLKNGLRMNGNMSYSNSEDKFRICARATGLMEHTTIR